MASIRACDRCEDVTENMPVWLWSNWHVFCPTCLPAVLAVECPIAKVLGPLDGPIGDLAELGLKEPEPSRVKFREFF